MQLTEKDWNDCVDPQIMLDLFRERPSKRKLRLFAVACCQRHQTLLTEEQRVALDVAESFADNKLGPDELRRAHDRAQEALDSFPEPDAWHKLSVYDQDATESQRNAVWAVVDATQEMAWAAAEGASVAAASAAAWLARIECGRRVLGKARDAAADRGYDAERLAQATILRDIFGDPFEKFFKTSSATLKAAEVLARTIYEQKAFGRINELAERLEQNGVLGSAAWAHCRDAGPHVRGCWVIDELLGRA